MMNILTRKLSATERKLIAIPIGVFAVYVLLIFGHGLGLDWRIAIFGPIAGLASVCFLVIGRKAFIPLLVSSFAIQAFILYQQN